MSEYQYYAFRAVDQPVSEEDQRWLRGLSTRAEITGTSFVNEYQWGRFKGRPYEMMDRCFDVYVYIANWGTRHFSLRLPTGAIDVQLASEYCIDERIDLRETKTHIVIDFDCSDEDAGASDGWHEASRWMGSLLPLRNDLLCGDLRSLYLAWLGGIDRCLIEDDCEEPPVPDGMKELTPPLQEFADFLNLEKELINVAAERSDPLVTDHGSPAELETWVRALPESEKDRLLVRIANGDDLNPRQSLLRGFREAASRGKRHDVYAEARPRRSVGEIEDAWEARIRERERRRAEEAERKRESEALAAAAARKKRLELVLSREPDVWNKVDALISARTPNGYDQAVGLLKDLRDASLTANRMDVFTERLGELRTQHARKVSFIERLRFASLHLYL